METASSVFVKDKKWRKPYYEAIRRVLLKEWDPIDIADVPEAQGEYDSYIPQGYKKLILRSPEHELFDYLWEVETNQMGLGGKEKPNRKDM